MITCNHLGCFVLILYFKKALLDVYIYITIGMLLIVNIGIKFKESTK